MTEGLFILTTIFVAYVVYQVVNDRKKPTTSSPQESVKQESVKKAEKAEPPKPQEAAKKAEPEAPKPALAESSESATAPSANKAGLRDPKTGEVSSGYTNYRFTKRWIKDALVAEGLLPKVYKNNELDSDTEAKIKTALAKLEAMDKYRA